MYTVVEAYFLGVFQALLFFFLHSLDHERVERFFLLVVVSSPLDLYTLSDENNFNTQSSHNYECVKFRTYSRYKHTIFLLTLPAHELAKRCLMIGNLFKTASLQGHSVTQIRIQISISNLD